ncbi:class I SAM-dependent methyltransferase [Paracoccaceae bacterium]|jgi:O-methyltransferase|nr:class I SAM-dependent methyltransferase [Paracoccaceae bacterium]
MSYRKPHYDPEQRLQPVHMEGAHFNVTDPQKFQLAIKLLKESLFDEGASLFASDNLITWNKNLSFLRQDRFINFLNDPDFDVIEKSIVWRTYILLYFAKMALQVEGDFLECGCCKGSTAHQVITDYDLAKHGKKYWLYDLFEWKEGDEHTQRPAHANPKMYDDIVARFSKFSNVEIIKGNVPDSFKEGFPDLISFCHIDMNHPAPEAGALQAVLPKLNKGGIIILDDYGWWGYSSQKAAVDPIIRFFGQEILELPTGQALLIKS